MRAVTVDTRGLWFSLKLALIFTVIGAGWSVWGPFAGTAGAEDKDSSVALASTLADNTNQEEETPILVLPSEGRFVHVDAKSMRITLYEGAEEVNSLVIEHIPPIDSPDVLVSGAYSITTTKESKLSTVTLVRFPSFVSFGDRYAFHGVPLDTNDAPLPLDYAGNSILLSNEDAATLAVFVEEGMQVYVDAPSTRKHGEAEQDTALSFIDDTLPATSASAYALQDMETGQVYLSKNEHDRYPIASITKLVTAVVASEIIGHGTEVQIANGEHYTLGDLFYPLLLHSDNDIAVRIAQRFGYNEFIAYMNVYMRAHGMERSSFADSPGLSPRNLSTAQDLMVLARRLYDNKEYLLAMTGEDEVTITSVEGHNLAVSNQNKLADDPYFRGGKLGYTDEARQTSLAIFTVPVGTEMRPVAVIVLGSQDWKQDTRTLLRWLSSSLEQ